MHAVHLCPEHVCTFSNGDELPKGHNHNICPRAECQTCKLFAHVAKDCVYANCLDVDVDWFNLLFTKSESTVQAYFAEVNGKRGRKYCAVELEINHLYILARVRAAHLRSRFYFVDEHSTSTPTKQLDTRLIEINFD